jgi:uncharacterized membrane protein YhhN
MIEQLSGFPLFTVVVCAGFLLDWAAITWNWKRLKPFTKPLAMILVLIWTLISSGWRINCFVVILLLAQSFGLAGDVFLLFSKCWFMSGLVSFLIGHFLYIGLLALIVIHQDIPQALSGMVWRGGLLLVIWAGILIGFYLIFRPSFRERSSHKLWFAVQFYIWVLSGMVIGTLLAAFSQPEPTALGLFLPLGGLLFLFSDAILAYDRFVENLNHAQLTVRITYHLAQLFLGIGLLHLYTPM